MQNGGKNRIRTTGLGIDAGGTFTDAVVYDLTANELLDKNKSLTTRWDYSEGIAKALGGLDSALLGTVDMVALSTTLATNAIVEDRGQKVGLLFMPPYGLFEPGDIPYEPKAMISGRLEITGVPIEKVDEAEVVRVARTMVDRLEVKAFAVSGFAGSINPDHELEVKKILKRVTGLDVSCGHELSDILDFRTRAYTAVLNGKIIPLLSRLLSDVRKVLRYFSIEAPLAVVRGDGTLMRGEAARDKPVETILSGPAASVAGAQYLTKRKDAVVVDMGGTTTDVAMLRNGRVCTDESGSYVGGHKTHVLALKIRTLGLGGDSLIAWKRGILEIGPERVVPAAWVGQHTKGIGRALDYYLDHPDTYRIDTGRLQILVPQGHHGSQVWTDQEKEVIKLLEERVSGPQELAERMGLPYWNPLITRRLEAHHMIQRCGFTPTDMLNCRGETELWDTEASRKLCDVLSRVLGSSPAQVIEDLKREVIRRFALVVFKRQLDEAVDPENMDICPVCRELVGNIVGETRDGYDLSLKLDLPVIGIGTPVHLFLPEAAGLLGTDAIMPEDADVANAVGAVTSKVVVRRRVEVRAYRDVFRIEGLPGGRRFTDFFTAKHWAERNLVRLVRETARNSGTSETDVKIHSEEQVHMMASGKPLFMGCSITAELSGRPLLRAGKSAEPSCDDLGKTPD